VKTALIFGSSGLIGGHILRILIRSDYYSKIKLFVRSEPKIKDSKLVVIRTNFNHLDNNKKDIKGEDCFYCIGTTRKNSPDKNEYRKVELEIPKKVAQIAKANDVNTFLFVSSGFADSNNSGEYLKFKGQVEEEIKALNFPKIGIVRPSFLIGNRKETRVGENFGIFCFKILSPFMIGPLKKMKPIQSEKVAKFMIKIANENLQQNTFESNEIVELLSG
tara:strand:+ start:1356 stop:2012 length:657 start_codon:yes stop_codon:yes gene_type:complete